MMSKWYECDVKQKPLERVAFVLHLAGSFFASFRLGTWGFCFGGLDGIGLGFVVLGTFAFLFGFALAFFMGFRFVLFVFVGAFVTG